MCEHTWKNIDYKRKEEYEEQIYSVIKKIIQTPGLFIGKKSVDEINTFLCGYCYTYIEFYSYQPHFDREFQTFVEERIGPKGVMHWNSIISNNRNDEDAFACFVELFEHL